LVLVVQSMPMAVIQSSAQLRLLKAERAAGMAEILLQQADQAAEEVEIILLEPLVLQAKAILEEMGYFLHPVMVLVAVVVLQTPAPTEHQQQAVMAVLALLLLLLVPL
jgi:hypothetical protein